jgi:hypothetical protein
MVIIDERLACHFFNGSPYFATDFRQYHHFYITVFQFNHLPILLYSGIGVTIKPVVGINPSGFWYRVRI